MIIVDQIRLINQKMILDEQHGMMGLLFKVVWKVRFHQLIMQVHKLISGVHREDIGLMNYFIWLIQVEIQILDIWLNKCSK